MLSHIYIHNFSVQLVYSYDVTMKTQKKIIFFNIDKNVTLPEILKKKNFFFSSIENFENKKDFLAIIFQK